MRNKRFWNIKIHIMILLALCLILSLLLWQGNKVVFWMALPVVLVFGLLTILRLRKLRRQIGELLTVQAQRLKSGDREALEQFPIPAIALSGRREILWYNGLFRDEVLGQHDLAGDNFDCITTTKLDDHTIRPTL